MPTITDLSPATPWVAFSTTEQDWQQAPQSLLSTMYMSMLLIRCFEEKVLDLAGQGLIHGPAHSAIGQEGGATGSVLAMVAEDTINGSHRAHHQFLAKALHYVSPDGIELNSKFNGDIVEVMRKTLAEIMGLSQGYCKGRGGSMHLRWQESGNLGTNAIVGGGVPFAAGSAFCHQRASTEHVAFSYFGDGASSIGSVLESMNLAAAWKLPLCFFVENNMYAVATHIDEVTAENRLSARGLGFAIPAWKVDGMDPLAVYLATQQAVEHMRAGGGPTLIEADVYRYFHQSGPLPGSVFGYRNKQEESEWRERDPIQRVYRELERREVIDPAKMKSIKTAINQTLDAIVDEFTVVKDGEREIKAELWPSIDFVDFGVKGDMSEFDDTPFIEQETCSSPLVDKRFIDTVANTMRTQMENDERIILMGEDIHRLNGGTNGATKDLAKLHPQRVIGTPICENAFVGLAGGMAFDGRYKPIVEFMYPDFMWVAADQVFNQIAKARHMFGGDTAMPLVLRTKVAMGTGYGSQHSMDPAGIFATSAGWRVLAPSTPFDYAGLMNSALRCQDPVLIIEHMDLYNSSGPVPEQDLDYFIEIGKAKVVRSGTKMTILTYSSMVQITQKVADELNLDVDIIDLRTLDRSGLDFDCIEQSLTKTGNLLIVEQGALGTSIGGMIADECQRRFFDLLDAPIMRVHGKEASPSVSKVLERAANAGEQDVVEGIRSLLIEMGIAA
ncbi:alpha-ketoacid dehydrogenase subunit alpha/beta [Thalassotalea mangrovi]|uniref:MFS transporter n=1 Tax=Thalassotalea mangrovi TaxID=2572245 RepID=A0A4U1B647_9GAMM|nr:alpha-ketoacid dehydrogenase subunit alpha/beta [Thalassotalea mangrovi]TKB45312.1 MFS transporter [Thalassotalea mangrovi]